MPIAASGVKCFIISSVIKVNTGTAPAWRGWVCAGVSMGWGRSGCHGEIKVKTWIYAWCVIRTDAGVRVGCWGWEGRWMTTPALYPNYVFLALTTSSCREQMMHKFTNTGLGLLGCAFGTLSSLSDANLSSTCEVFVWLAYLQTSSCPRLSAFLSLWHVVALSVAN